MNVKAIKSLLLNQKLNNISMNKKIINKKDASSVMKFWQNMKCRMKIVISVHKILIIIQKDRAIISIKKMS
jgi:hypothetical protein